MPSGKIVGVAASEALASKMKHAHGCVIYYKDRIIGKGHNRWLTLNASKRFMAFHRMAVHSVHAEISALIKAVERNGGDLRRVKVYVHRRGGGNSKPCNPCMAAILSTGIHPKSVEWSGQHG